MAASVETEEYIVLEKIGHGSFGVIKKVLRKSDNFVCTLPGVPLFRGGDLLVHSKVLCRKEISYVKMSAKEREQLHAEFSILNSLRHPNIVAYYHREHLKSTQDLHIYMEYCGGGDLSQVIEKLRRNNQFAEESFVWSIFSQLVTALYRCHYGVDAPEVGDNVMGLRKAAPLPGLRPKNQIMILHRDLKPENVFLGEDNSVKLGDFGLSKLMQSHDFASTYVGTPFYMSPEICGAERYTLHSDIWSLGCIMYELCARAPPFNAKTHFHLVQKIKEGRVDSLPNVYSQELQNAIKSCLKTNPTHRPDTATLLNLPMIRLMRKQREVVELGKILKTNEERAARKLLEAEAKAAGLDAEIERMRISIDGALRREWELKAMLEINRRVKIEVADQVKAVTMQHEMDIQSQVDKAVMQRLEFLKHTKDHVQRSPTDIRFSSVSTSVETDFPSSTDLSSLSIDSPPVEKTKPLQAKKTARTPFTRARTNFDSPMDIQMGEPSPMSIACLSLSPRRTAVTSAASNIPDRRNIFAAAAAAQLAATNPLKPKVHSLPLSSSPPSSSEPNLEDDEDCLPDLPSPSRLPAARADIFRQPGARPGLFRQKTAPSRRLSAQPTALFPAGPAKNPRIPSPTNTTASGSPVRKAPLRPSAAGDNDMFKAVMQRNLRGNGGGRTLVELAQARVALAPIQQQFGENQTVAGSSKDLEVPIWDPEKDEMPSPFLIRGGKGLRRL
ncbi:G2-specific serine/threonine protein kinase [Pseudocyphellaria aurata]|nr:G2-specific serine/threonine protein kinase [Pseudocyphellaria aurata]